MSNIYLLPDYSRQLTLCIKVVEILGDSEKKD